jgi:hypothetical protein
VLRPIVSKALLAIVIIVLAPGALLARQAPKGKSSTVAATVVPPLLEKSGYNYSKVGDGVWEITFTGKNLKEFPMRIATNEDVVLVMVKVSDRNGLKLTLPFTNKLLELNDRLDSIKFALSEDMLYIRTEIRSRVLDLDELKYLIEQMSGAVDIAYPQIKPFLGAAK